jgi:hypothetical protein
MRSLTDLVEWTNFVFPSKTWITRMRALAGALFRAANVCVAAPESEFVTLVGRARIDRTISARIDRTISAGIGSVSDGFELPISVPA